MTTLASRFTFGLARALRSPPGEGDGPAPNGSGVENTSIHEGATDEPGNIVPVEEGESGEKVETKEAEPKVEAVEVEEVESTVPKKRLDETIAQRWAETRAREQAEARAALAEESLRQMRALAAGEDPATHHTNGSGSDEARIAAGVAEQRFTDRCNEVALKGKSTHADFDTSLTQLRAAAGGVLPRTFVEVALKVGDPEEIIYHLGKDTVKADEILRMDPISQGIALKELVREVKKAPSVAISAVKAPIKPATGSGGNKSGDKSSSSAQTMEEFMSARAKEEKEYKDRRANLGR